MSKQISWKVVVGTNLVQLPKFNINDSIIVKAGADNTGKVYIGNDGDDKVASTTGFELAASEYVLFDVVGRMSDIYAISSAAGQSLFLTIGRV